MSHICNSSKIANLFACAACFGAATCIHLFSQQIVQANPGPVSTSETLPGTGSPGWNWDSIGECTTWCPDAVSETVYSPVTIATTANIRRPSGCYEEQNGTIIDPLPVEFDTRYSTVHSWKVSGGVTVGAEATVQNGLLSRVIVKGRVRVSGEVTVEGSRGGSETYEYGKKWCLPIPSCLGIEICHYYDDYKSTASQSVGELYTSVIVNDDGTIQEGDPCLFVFETFTAAGDGDTRHITTYEDFAPCGDDCEDPRDKVSRIELESGNEVVLDPVEEQIIPECDDSYYTGNQAPGGGSTRP